MKSPEVKRLKDLEKENASLKRIIAEQALENRVLKDWAEGNF
jgi:putative transposase